MPQAFFDQERTARDKQRAVADQFAISVQPEPGAPVIGTIQLGELATDAGVARLAATITNAYLSAIVIIHRQVPGRDKLDDYCHIVEAAYCGIFVTADEQLARAVPNLHPGLKVLRFTDLVATSSRCDQ